MFTGKTYKELLPKEHAEGIDSVLVNHAVNKAILDLVPDEYLSKSQGEANEGETMGLKLNAFNGMATLKKVGIPQALFDWFSKDGIANYADGKLTFVHGDFTYPVPMTLTHVQAANLGTLPSHVKQDYQFKFGVAITTLKKKVEENALATGKWAVAYKAKDHAESIAGQYGLPSLSPQSDKTLEELNPPALKPNPFSPLSKEALNAPYDGPTHWTKEDEAKLAKAKGPSAMTPVGLTLLPTKIFVADSQDWPVFPLEMIKIADLVPLHAAAHMYQPVKGSTPGKRYYCVALNADFRLGVAYQQGEVSFRIESPNWDANHNLLYVVPGLAIKNGYASFHLAVSDEHMARKVVGAFMADTGIAWDTPLPNISIIKV